MPTRKEFLKQLAALSTLPMVGLPEVSGHPPFWTGSTSELFPTFDLHCHPGVFFSKDTPAFPGDEALNKTVREMKSSGLSGGFFSMVMDMPLLKREENGIVPTRSFAKGEGWKEYKRQLSIINALFDHSDVRKAVRPSDISRSHTNTAAFLSCEGGDFIAHVDQLDEVYADGVRSIQLVHYAPNPLGDLQTYEEQHQGLSPLGKTVVKKMNALGMVIDVAHASFKTVQDVVELTNAPIILSHSILKMEPTRPIAARAITAEHAKLVAQTGGVIGAWPSGFNQSFDEFVDNTLRLIDAAGIDHVGLGTDMDSNYKPVLSSYTQLATWTDALKKKGLSEEDVQMVAGGNAVRVLEKILK